MFLLQEVHSYRIVETRILRVLFFFLNTSITIFAIYIVRKMHQSECTKSPVLCTLAHFLALQISVKLGNHL